MQLSYKFEGTEIHLEQGDLTESKAEAIVNAANNRLLMGGGVAGVIKRRGGATIEKEAVSKGPISVGEATITQAGNLKAKYVIHAAVMGMDFKTDAQKIKKAIFNTLRRAREQKISTVALPALGTGVGGFPYLESAQVMLGETKKFLKNNPASFKRITFVLYGDAAFKAFQEVFQASLN